MSGRRQRRSSPVILWSLVCLAGAAVLPLPASGAPAAPAARADGDLGREPVMSDGGGVRADTLWIFDADFSDLVGDNAGWISHDRSGTPGQENYWHRDTLRPCPRPAASPGSLSWWCGVDTLCWKQPRGYGNNWLQTLERDLPLAAWSAAGDTVTLEFDQRYAMERVCRSTGTTLTVIGFST